MFSNPKTTIGIDLGTHSVKVVQLSKFGEGTQVDKALLIQLDAEGSE